MSGWGMGWFGGAAAKKKDAPKNAILQLRSTLEMLTKRERHLQAQMDEQDNVARKQLTANNKAQAKAALRRKKQFEHSLEQTSSHMMTVEKEISSIESANINKETLDAMKNAGAAMKQIHNGMTIDKVDATLAELDDQHAIANEIGEALTKNDFNAVDDDELDAELADLEEEQLNDKMLGTGSIPVGDKVDRLPTPAQGELKGKRPVRREEENEDEELERLQAEMAM